MGINKIQRFDRGNYILVINAATGEKWKEWKEPRKVQTITTESGEVPVKGPGKLRKAANFAAAAAKHVATGRRVVSLEVIQNRFSICSKCPDNLFAEIEPKDRPAILKNHEGQVGTCLHKKCGCYIHELELFPNKIAWATQRCPLNHWDREKIDANATTV